MADTSACKMAESEKHALQAAANLRIANQSLQQELERTKQDAELRDIELRDKVVKLEKELHAATKGSDSDEPALHDEPAHKRRRDNRMKKKKEEAEQKEALLRAVHKAGSAPPSETAQSVPKEYCHLPGKSPWEQYRRVASIDHKQAEKTLKDLSEEKRKNLRNEKNLRDERARARKNNSYVNAAASRECLFRTRLQEIADDEIAIANGEYSRAEFEEQLARCVHSVAP